MGAAIALRDVVGEAEHVLVIAVIPLHRDFDRDAVLLADGVDRLRDQLGFGLVEVFDERLHAALIFEDRLIGLGVALIAEDDLHAGVQEGQLAQAVLQRLAVIIGLGEGRRRGEEAHGGAGIGLAIVAVRGLAPLDQGRLHAAPLDEADPVFLAIAVNGQLQPVRQRVHDGHADAVKAARDLVGV